MSVPGADAGSGGAGGGGGPVSPVRRVPQLEQNCALASTVAPQVGQLIWPPLFIRRGNVTRRRVGVHHDGMNALRGAALLAAGFFALPAQVRADASGELARYLAAPDASYAWREVKSSRLGATEVTQLVLTSQTWRGIPWKHQLVILRPSTLERSATQAFLFIHGGRWRPEYETGEVELPREARIFARLAETLRTPVAVLRHVPFQPLFDRREDALIAYTFDHYLTSGETDWPLLLPMVKSAARAMDAVQAFARERWQLTVDAFTVAG